MILCRWQRTCVLFGLLMAFCVQDAGAGTLTLQWDPSPDSNAAGYVVFIGTSSGNYSASVDVGSSTSYVFPNAVSGQNYYFAVAAYSPEAILGAKSSEVSGRVAEQLSLANPGDQTTVVGQPVTLQLVGSDPSGATLGYEAVGLPPGLMINSVTGMISGTPTTVGNFAVTASVYNNVGYVSQAFWWTIQEASSGPDPDPAPRPRRGPKPK